MFKADDSNDTVSEVRLLRGLKGEARDREPIKLMWEPGADSTIS